MTPQRITPHRMTFAQLRPVIEHALALPKADRDAYLVAHLPGNDAALAEARSLLTAAEDASAAGFLAPPSPASAGTTAETPPTNPIKPSPHLPPTPSPTGTLIDGRYRLLEPIGEGGMGTVWMAEQRSPVKRLVALKLIKPGMDSRAVLTRFEAERQALAMMDHPNIARVLDGGTTSEGRPYFVMELVRGLPITTYADQRKLSVKDRLILFQDVCAAVQHAHQKGVIHRDLKPTNVLVTEADAGKPLAKVIDFGLAKALAGTGILTDQTLHTTFGTAAGTPRYMAPEQVAISALDIDTRADIYALGVLLYELLTGTTPHTKEQINEAAWDEICRMIRDEEPPRPSSRVGTSANLPSLAATRATEPKKLSGMIKGDLDWIVLKALEKDRNRRYETANGFSVDIGRHLDREPVLAVPATLRYRARKFICRHRGASGAALTIIIAILLGAGGIYYTSLQTRRVNRQLDNMVETARSGLEKIVNRAAVVEGRARLSTPSGSVGILETDDTSLEISIRANQSLLVPMLVKNAIEAFDREAKANELLRLERDTAVHLRDVSEKEHKSAIQVKNYMNEMLASADPSRIPDKPLTVIDLLDQTIFKLDNESGSLPEVVEADVRRTISEAMLSLGEAHRAETQARRGLARLAGKTADQVLVAKLFNRLGAALYSQGKLEAANEAFLEAHSLRDLPVGLETANLIHLGLIARELGKFAEADRFYSSAVDSRRASGQEDGLWNILTDYANLKNDLGQIEESIKLNEQAALLARRQLSPKSPDLIPILLNLGDSRGASGELESAMSLYRECLAICKSSLPSDHPLTARSFASIGTTHRKLKQYKDGEEHLRAAISINQKHAHGDPLELAENFNSLGVLLSESGREKEAEEAFSQAVAEVEKSPFRLSTPRLNRALVSRNLGLTLLKTSQMSEAARAFTIAINDERAANRSYTEQFASDLVNLVNSQRSANLPIAEREASLRELIAFYGKLGGHVESRQAATLSCCDLLTERGRFADCTEAAELALKMIDELSGVGRSPDPAIERLLLAMARHRLGLQMIGRTQEGERIAEKAKLVLSKYPGYTPSAIVNQKFSVTEGPPDEKFSLGQTIQEFERRDPQRNLLSDLARFGATTQASPSTSPPSNIAAP